MKAALAMPPLRVPHGETLWQRAVGFFAVVLPILIAILIGIPMLIVLGELVRPAGIEWAHVRTTLLPSYVRDTAILGLGVTAGATLIGTALAWFTSNYDFPGVKFFGWAVGLPIALPGYISAYTYAHITGITGPLFRMLRGLFGREFALNALIDMMNLRGCIFVMIFALYPYVYFSARSFFAGSSRHYIETARASGRSDPEIFIRVALPIARPSIIAGAALVLMETLNEYGATSYFGVQSMVTGIFRAWFGLGDVETARRLAGYFLVGVVALLLIERISRRQRRYEHADVAPEIRYRPGRASGFAMCISCGVALSIGLLVPLAQLLAWIGRSVSFDSIRAISEILFQSVLLSGLAGALCVGATLLMLVVLRRKPGTLSSLSYEIAGSGYAIPGAIISVGVLAGAGLVRDASSVFLIGSFGLLLYAYLVRYLAVTMKPLQAALEKIPGSFDDTGALAGHKWVSVFTRVHIPLLRPAMGAGLFVVFIDILKELPMTLVLRPFNFHTLATRAYEYAQQDRLQEAALPSVVIVLAGLVPALLLSMRWKSHRPRLEPAGVTRAR